MIDGTRRCDHLVLAVPAPAADDVEPLAFELVGHLLDVGRIVLPIAVAVTTSRPRANAKPAANASRLAEVAAEPDDAERGDPAPGGGELRERIVRAPVVDDDDLVGAPSGHERRGQLVVEVRFDVG
jgi:hypothetical protein